MKVLRNISKEDCEGFYPNEDKALSDRTARDILARWPDRFKEIVDPNEEPKVPKNIDEIGGYRQSTIDALKKVYEEKE